MLRPPLRLRLSRPHHSLLFLYLILFGVVMASAFVRAMSSLSASKSKVVHSAPSKHTATLFFLHGLGDSASGGWSEVVPLFQSRFPYLKVVLPNAPVAPVTLNGGFRMQSWHDIKSLDQIDREDFKGLDDSRAQIDGLIAEEVASGIPGKRIILGGFSQGGAVSLYTGLQSKVPLAGILALSSYLPHTKGNFGELVAEENKDTPILQCHGDADNVVRYSIGKRTFDELSKIRGGKNIELKTYRGMAHQSCEEEMRDVADFIGKVLEA